MRISISKGSGQEHVRIARDDGTAMEFRIPSKGPVPHDAVHFFVESELGLGRGFWGSVAAGEDPGAIQRRARAGGHASASRAGVPDAGLVELLQAERLVECFEAESWSSASDHAGLMALAHAGWEASHVPPLPCTQAQAQRIRDAIAAFGRTWQALPPGGTLELDWSLREETRNG